MLKEWDLDKIFKGFNDRLDEIKQESNRRDSDILKTESPIKLRNESNSKNILDDKGNHKRNDSDSRVPTYGFRRENSDFFPSSSSRHSAIFLETKSILDKSEGLFSRGRRGSEVAAASVAGFPRKSDAEPVLMDFSQNSSTNNSIKTSSSFDLTKEKTPKTKDNSKSKFVNSIFDFKKTDIHLPLRPRREKTDGEIVVRPRNEKRQDLRDEVEARRLEVAFSREMNSGERFQHRRRSNLQNESFDGGNINGGFNGSLNDFNSSLNSLSFSDLQAQVSFFLKFINPGYFILFFFKSFFPFFKIF